VCAWTEAASRRHFKVSNDPHFADKPDAIVGLYLCPPEHALVQSWLHYVDFITNGGDRARYPSWTEQFGPRDPIHDKPRLSRSEYEAKGTEIGKCHLFFSLKSTTNPAARSRNNQQVFSECLVRLEQCLPW
jgi:hypothetical protein